MLKIINKLLLKKWFPVSLRVVTLIAFIGLVIIGFSSPTNDPFFLKQLSRTNLTTVFVWRLWWPLVVLSAIFLGRAWCMVCPVEMITTFFAKIGFKHKRPKWILSGWVINVFYFIVLAAGIAIVQIDQNPKYTSFYLLILIGISILSGMIFEKNTFCQYICPVGYLLGLLSKMSMWGWRVKDKSVCDACIDKSCISIKYTYQLNYKSCGVGLYPANITSNNQCLLCGGCLKSCDTYKTVTNHARPNPALVKIGFANDLMQIQPFLLVEWAFLFIITGSMIFEMNQFQFISDTCTSIITQNISDLLGLKAGLRKDLIGTAYLFLFLPLILWLLPYTLIRFFRLRISLNNYLKDISIIFLPVIMTFYIGLVVMEVATRLPYYRYIVHDIKGVETIKAILFKQIAVPQLPQWTNMAFFIILVLALIAGILISFKVIRKLVLKFQVQKNKIVLFFLPVIFVITLFATVFMYLSF